MPYRYETSKHHRLCPYYKPFIAPHICDTYDAQKLVERHQYCTVLQIL